MQPYWDLVTEGVLVDRRPGRIVEIGSKTGASTLNLLTFARDHSAFVDVIDVPEPPNLPELEALLPEYGALHQGPSLEVLSRIPIADVYFIDGDPNWYTVHHQLTNVAATAADAQARAPLFILNGVGWPYGRRDLYADPSAIPNEYRQPYQRGGLRYGESALATDGGVNHHLFHAVSEGGARNGVRSAVDDFLEARPKQYRYYQSDALGGLGFLIPAVDQRHPYAARVARFCEVPSTLRPLVDALEQARIAAMTSAGDFRWQREQTQRALEAALQEQQSLRGQIQSLEQAFEEVTGTRGFRSLEAVRGMVRRLRNLR